MLFDIKATLPKLPVGGEYPFYNEPTAVVDYLSAKPKTYDDIDYWLERTPEMISILDAITTDIMADGFKFIGGKQAVNRAENFSRMMDYPQQLRNAIWDRHTYGDDFIWLGVPSEENLKEIFKKITGKDDFELSPDEDTLKALRYVPTNTMSVIHDSRVVKKFRQQVQGKGVPIDFPPEQIVHGKYLQNKGKITGFAPTMALLPEMQTISYLKDYAGSWFKSGGIPEWMFIFPDEQPESASVLELRQKLERYKHPQRKHGNLVITGNVTPTKMGEGLNKDMEFRQLAVYLTAVLGQAYGMPMSRIGSIIGAEVKIGSGSDDLANEGYWAKIDHQQSYTERLHNSQIWQKYFGVEMKFNKAWKINEIKEQQRNQFTITNMASLNQELLKHKKNLSLPYIQRVLNLRDEDLISSTGLDLEVAGPSSQSPQMDNRSIERSGATEAMREDKRKQVRDNQKI